MCRRGRRTTLKFNNFLLLLHCQFCLQLNLKQIEFICNLLLIHHDSLMKLLSRRIQCFFFKLKLNYLHLRGETANTADFGQDQEICFQEIP